MAQRRCARRLRVKERPPAPPTCWRSLASAMVSAQRCARGRPSTCSCSAQRQPAQRQTETESKRRQRIVSWRSPRVDFLLEFVPRTLAAQAQSRTFAAHYLKYVKHRRSHGLAGEHCARSVDEKASLHGRFFREGTQSGLGRGRGKGL